MGSTLARTEFYYLFYSAYRLNANRAYRYLQVGLGIPPHEYLSTPIFFFTFSCLLGFKPADPSSFPRIAE